MYTINESNQRSILIIRMCAYFQINLIVNFQMESVLKEIRATTLMNSLHQTRTKQASIPNQNDLAQPCMQRASKKAISSTNNGLFYHHQSKQFLKQGRIEESKESQFMKTYYQNKKLAYRCMTKQYGNKLDQNLIQLQRQLYPERFSADQFQEKIKALRQPLNTGFISAEHPPKVIPSMSHAAINEKIQQLQLCLAEFKVRGDQCLGRSNFHWKEAVILEKCGQIIRSMKEREAWEASFKEAILWNQKIRQTEDQIYQLIQIGFKYEQQEADKFLQAVAQSDDY